MCNVINSVGSAGSPQREYFYCFLNLTCVGRLVFAECAGNASFRNAVFSLRKPHLSLPLEARNVFSVIAPCLSVPTLCTDVCCRFRSQHSRPESPSYDLQARTSPPMIARKDSPLHSGPISPRSSAEKERILAFKRGSSPDEAIEIKHNADCRPTLTRDSTPMRKRRHTSTSIKTENEFDELPPKTEEKTARDLEPHSWKLSAVEVECGHCSERKLLPCSYLKLSPSLVQSGILPRIPRFEGESACRGKPERCGSSDQWRLSRTATCA